MELYHATGGPNWNRSRHWLSSHGINLWSGVETNPDGHVTELVLPYNNLTGSVPPELGDLAHLEKLLLYGNELGGQIPATLGSLTGLRRLSLSSNDLEGPIPPELGNLTRLDALYLSINRLSGPIPSTFGNLTALVHLSLFENQLSGPIPSEFGKLERLKDLWLLDNLLEGPLPPELGDMNSLEDLNLSGNRINGPIPPEWGGLQSLKAMSIADNQVSGGIPRELGNLSTLEELNLSGNELSGPIPAELGNLDSLELLWLFDNELSGEIPPQLGDLDNIRKLAIGDNDLTGPLPPEIAQLTTLEELNVGRNNLSGPIPPELGNLPALKGLDLSSNNFSGRLPPEIGDIGTLEVLAVVDNEGLTGLVPRRLMDLENLSSLVFYATGLCAQIDDEFQQWLRALSELGLSGCDAGTVERFVLIDLHDRMAGESWSNRDGWKSGSPVGSWEGVTTEGGRVRELALPNNGLQGPFLAEIANLTELEVLDLGGNDLIGELPQELTSMSELAEIRIGNNPGLEGVLPFGLTQLQRVEVLDYAGTGLCASPSSTFQAWYAGIDSTSGAICGNLEQVALSLPVVYLTQSVQSPSRNVRLVADREALLRVFVTSEQPGAFFEPRVRATFMRGLQEVHRVTMERHGDEIATVADEGELDLSYNAVIPAEHMMPGVELVVEVDPDGTVPHAPGSVVRFPPSGAEPLNVVGVPPMEVTVVPVIEAEVPDSSIFEWTRDLSGKSPQMGLLRYAFPFSEFSARARETYVTSLDLSTDDGQWRLVLELEALRAAEDGTGYYYGVASSVTGRVRGIARLGAWVSIGKAWDTELAHEVGHNLNLRHAPCGGPLNTEPEFPYPDGSIGVWGYDFRDGSVVSPERRRDIMGYCYDQGWLSDFYFEKVIDYRERVEGDAARARLAGSGVHSDMLVLWGGVVGGQLRLEPAFSMHTAPRLPEETGSYRLEGTGRGGQSEFSLAFTPGEDQFGNKYFFFTIPVEPGWDQALERITLTGPEGTVTMRANDQSRISVVTERSSGEIRGILRDWEGALPASLARRSGLDVQTMRSLSEAIRLRR